MQAYENKVKNNELQQKLYSQHEKNATNERQPVKPQQKQIWNNEKLRTHSKKQGNSKKTDANTMRVLLFIEFRCVFLVFIVFPCFSCWP